MNKLKKQQICNFLTGHRFKTFRSVECHYNLEGVEVKKIYEYTCDFCGKKVYDKPTAKALRFEKYVDEMSEELHNNARRNENDQS